MMKASTQFNLLPAPIRHSLAAPLLRWCALLLLCGAYLQGGFDKMIDFPGAIAEVRHFGLEPAAPLAVATIICADRLLS
jgi:uncharacterized membrane protein YphA (DoxX/SURF4 family)